MECRPAGWSVCLPLLIFPCTIKSRSSLLVPADPGSPGKRAVKQLWWWWFACSTTAAAILWPLRRTTCVSRHPQLRTEDFVGAKCYCPQAVADGNSNRVIIVGRHCEYSREMFGGQVKSCWEDVRQIFSWQMAVSQNVSLYCLGECFDTGIMRLLWVSDWVSSFLTAHRHIIGYSVP